jgi:RNA polymerase sigma factor (sigma-70 family)
MDTARSALPDNALLGILISRRPALVESVAGITGCRGIAEDVVQEAYLRLSAFSAPCLPVKARVSYVYQVVRNLAIDHYRRHALEQKRLCHEKDSLNVESHWGQPEHSQQHQDTLRIIAKALDEVPQRKRYVFEMYRLHGKEQKEIARELGVSPTLVNFMLKDVLIHLKKALAEERLARHGSVPACSARES